MADAYDPPAGYYASATGTGATLRQNLYAITKTNFTYRTYGDARYALAPLWQDPANATNLITIYSSKSVTAAWDSGVTWNREHIATENSLGISVSNSYSGYGSDLFELAPAVPSDNESRSNLGYGYTGSTTTPSKTTYGSVTGTDGNKYWYAGQQFEGDVARTLFYMATRYGYNQAVAGTIDASNKYNITLANGVPNTTGQFGDLNTLLHWAYEDPIDTFERHKNALIYSGFVVSGTTYKQGNRNPYIDHPEYIWAAFGTKANTSQLSVSTPAADGSSSLAVDLGRVIAGTSFGTSSTTISKSGDTPTTFNVTTTGAASSTLTGTGEAFDFGSASRTMTATLATPFTAGPVSGTVTVQNTDLTTAGAGQGSADGNDVISLSGTAVDPSDASFSSAGDSKHLTLSFGYLTQGSGVQTLGFSLSDLLSASGYTAGLDLDAINGTGNTSALYTNLAPFSNLSAGSSSPFLADVNTSAIGTYSAEYTLSVSDENIPGATAGQSLVLDLTGSVVAAGLFVDSGQTYHLPVGTGTGIQVVTYPTATVNATGILILDPAPVLANRQLLSITGAYSLAGSTGNWTGLIDIGNNDIDLAAASLADVTDQVRQGFAGGNWNGSSGIISSSAAADSSQLTTIGVIQNNQSGAALYTAANPFDGTTPGIADILLKFTYYGDANLDGQVDGSDYSLIDNGYLTQATGWYNGDFNYDGVIDGSDYTLIDNAYNSQGVQLTDQVASPTTQIGSTAAAVPEPTSALLLIPGLAVLARRRRKC